MNQYQEFIHKSRYARYIDTLNRRESWEETVNRYVTFMRERFSRFPTYLGDEIYNMNIMPSMRSLMTAGIALDRDEMAGYNCSYITVDHVRAFDENLYVLLCELVLGFLWKDNISTNFQR